MKRAWAFTLIEMLVVIAIIGILATLVVHMNQGAQAAKLNSTISAQKASLTMMINSYQSKLNYYPPDNAAMSTNPALSVYDGLAAINPLIYELKGGTNNPPNTTGGYIQGFDGYVLQSAYNALFGRVAINNANTDEPHDFFYAGPKPNEYTNYTESVTESVVPVTNFIKGLVVPARYSLSPPDPTNFHNFWHYDASSASRHNQQSYDLWAEYSIGGKGGSNIVVTNANW